MKNFQNEPLDIFQLPQFEKVTLNKLSDKYINVLHINMIILYFIGLVISLAYYFIAQKTNDFKFNFWLVVVGFSFFSLIYVYQYFFYKTKKYCFREQDVIHKCGLISETTTIIPFNKMQHIALNQGWISRLFHLAHLQFFTAGGSSIDLSIPGLPFEEAEKYRAYVLSFISQKEAIEQTIDNPQSAVANDDTEL